MFYAQFVLAKKGPLARVWLAAHWDKKLTKAHVFETNIGSSVEAIMKPKVKLALRTSGHLLLGVVRIYSRKAKYLLADCNEAFVKIKMAFRPGVVDLPEENREAAVAAITLQENFHDFDALDDLNDIDVQAQFSTVNQSRPEEITMKEDLTTISFVGDDGFGDVGFDERELLRDAQFEASLYKSPRPDISLQHIQDKSDTMLAEPTGDAHPMEVDLPPAMDGFGGGFMGDELLGAGDLFEDTPAVPDVSMPPPPDAEHPKTLETTEATHTTITSETSAVPATPATVIAGPEQTTLITNEQEAFALEPLDTTHMPGTDRVRGKRKRKLIVDEQQGIPSETMKQQLSDTSDIVTTLDLAPPTKKLMHWKETGGVEKLFALTGRSLVSKAVKKMFKRNLKTRPMEEEEGLAEERLELEATEITREEDRSAIEKSRAATTTMTTVREEISTIIEEPSVLESSRVSTRRSAARASAIQTPVAEPQQPTDTSLANQTVTDLMGASLNEPHVEMPPEPHFQHFDDPGSIAPPFSVGPDSVGPPSVGAPEFGGDIEGGDKMPEDAEQEENRWTKRTEQMQGILDTGFRYTDELSFKDMARKLNRKQVTSKFYTLLVLKKHKVVEVEQTEAFGDILIRKGPRFGMAC